MALHNGSFPSQTAFRAGLSKARFVSMLAMGGGSGNGGPIRPIRLGGGGPHDSSGGSSSSSGSSWGRPWGSALMALSGLSLAAAGPASAKGKPEPPVIIDKTEGELTVDNVTEMLWRLAGPILSNLGFSGCIGLMAGIALKKVGQLLAVIIGLAFAAVQGLAYSGFITVNWSHIQDRVTQVLDANNDGKLDEQDFKHYVNSGLGMLSAGVPSVGGFLAGFLMGLRM